MERLIRDISDTAVLAAMYRVLENERSNPLFRDPYARSLAGARGDEIFRRWKAIDRYAWGWAVRTYLFDLLLAREVVRGAKLVVNLAAGLDSRPYRMPLPASLTWVEVDLPEVIERKDAVLRGEEPVCTVERVALDLTDVPARRALLAELGGRGREILVLTEGLLMYLSRSEVASLAEDLAAVPAFGRWLADLASPGLLRLLHDQIGGEMSRGNAPLRFAPPEGPEFFRAYGWNLADVRSILRVGAQLGRAHLSAQLLARLPDWAPRHASRPWAGVCLLERASGPPELNPS